MKITFVRPSMIRGRARDAMEPLQFAILSRLTPPDIDRTLVDERIENFSVNDRTDLAAISVETFSARRAYEIASEYRQRGIPVVMGGAHASLCTDEVLQYADSVVVGDAEGLWPGVIDDFRNGGLKRLYTSRYLPSLRDFCPDRSIFRGKKYGVLSVCQFSRGCNHACDFCAVHSLYGHTIRHADVDDVVADVESARRRTIFFVDDNLFANREMGERLCNALKPLKRQWGCQVSLEIAGNEPLLKLMADSGCLMAVVGFESVDQENLRQMRKEWNHRLGDYGALVRRFTDHGIMVYGTFVLGYDADTLETIKACLDFSLHSGLALANFNPLMPFPGTHLYDRLKAENRLLYERWWLDEDYRFGKALFRPKCMSAEELEQSCLSARREFNRSSSILRRLVLHAANRRHAGIFLVANLASRQELWRKMGAKLGTDAQMKAV